MTNHLGPGLYTREQVSHDVYHADPCERPSLSSHIANIVVGKSPGHAALCHPRLGGAFDEASDEMDTGSLLHGLLLGGAAGIVEVDAKDWRTNEAKRQRAEARAAGRLPVLKDKLQVLRGAAVKIREVLPIPLDVARTEVTALWRSTEDCPCRCRIDALMPDLWIWDLKFCEDAMVSSADRNIAASGYHVQAAANIDAIESLEDDGPGRVRFGLCFVEWKNPEIGIVRREIRGQLLDVGQQRWNRAKAIWARCLKENRWPGYSTEIIEANCPAWIASEELETQLTSAGTPPF